MSSVTFADNGVKFIAFDEKDAPRVQYFHDTKLIDTYVFEGIDYLRVLSFLPTFLLAIKVTPDSTPLKSLQNLLAKPSKRNGSDIVNTCVIKEETIIIQPKTSWLVVSTVEYRHGGLIRLGEIVDIDRPHIRTPFKYDTTVVRFDIETAGDTRVLKKTNILATPGVDLSPTDYDEKKANARHSFAVDFARLFIELHADGAVITDEIRAKFFLAMMKLAPEEEQVAMGLA